MAHPVVKNPQVSVLLAVHNAEAVLARTVESVLAQGYRGFELIIVDCDSTDTTPRKLVRYAEHDIRIEVLHRDDGDVLAGRDAALAAARGAHALFMEQGDWIAPDYLSSMVASAEQGFELVFSALSLDTTGEGGSRSSVAIQPAPQEWDSADAFRRGVVSLLGDYILVNITGKLVQVDRLRELSPKLTFKDDSLGLALAYLDGVTCACVLPEPCYHVAYAGAMPDAAFDPGMYGRIEGMQTRLLDRIERWGLARDAACMESLHRLHLVQVIHCIENTCLSAGRLTSIERRQRVQDMIDAPSTRTSIEALRASSKDFGLMYAPIARRSAAACCMGARIQDIVSRTLAPFAPARLAFH